MEGTGAAAPIVSELIDPCATVQTANAAFAYSSNAPREVTPPGASAPCQSSRGLNES